MIFSFCLGLWFHSRGVGFRASSSRLASHRTPGGARAGAQSLQNTNRNQRVPTVPPLAPYHHHHGVGPGERNDPSAGRDDGCDVQTFVASGGIDVSISFFSTRSTTRRCCLRVRLHSYHVCIVASWICGRNEVFIQTCYF